MIKGIFKTDNPAGTFLLPLSNCLYHHFPLHGGIVYFAYMVHHIDTILSDVTSLFEPYFISKVTLFNEYYFVYV